MSMARHRTTAKTLFFIDSNSFRYALGGGGGGGVAVVGGLHGLGVDNDLDGAVLIFIGHAGAVEDDLAEQWLGDLLGRKGIGIIVPVPFRNPFGAAGNLHGFLMVLRLHLLPILVTDDDIEPGANPGIGILILHRDDFGDGGTGHHLHGLGGIRGAADLIHPLVQGDFHTAGGDDVVGRVLGGEIGNGAGGQNRNPDHQQCHDNKSFLHMSCSPRIRMYR